MATADVVQTFMEARGWRTGAPDITAGAGLGIKIGPADRKLGLTDYIVD